MKSIWKRDKERSEAVGWLNAFVAVIVMGIVIALLIKIIEQ